MPTKWAKHKTAKTPKYPASASLSTEEHRPPTKKTNGYQMGQSLYHKNWTPKNW
jgi:hypothetical protein